MAIVEVKHDLRPWTVIFDEDFVERCLKALSAIPPVITFPQQMRLLENEGDVGCVLLLSVLPSSRTDDVSARSDVVLTNILTPILPILNSLLRPEFKQDFEITIQHQTARKFSAQVWDKERQRNVWRDDFGA
jgi:hypothetical protein